MPRILIIGATGFIGSALAASLLRSGEHIVYGLARTAEKARQIAVNEVIPIICSDPLKEPKPWLDLVQAGSIDVIVDASGARADTLDFVKAVKAAGENKVAKAKSHGVFKPPKLGFVFVSGTWIHGSSPSLISDLDVVGHADAMAQPPKISAALPQLEQAILSCASAIDVAIVRPALVYGYGSWIWGDVIFKPLINAARASPQPAKLLIKLNPDSVSALVHVEDVASGLHATIDKLPLISGTNVYPIFDLSTTSEKFSNLIESAARVIGYQGEIQLVGAGADLFESGLSTIGNVDSSRAKQLLDWQPKKFGMEKYMHVYAKAWEASYPA